ncbi:hypothetical protein [Erwinia tasmaniensis]|uniref:hypothetical protein n=1 Tax=Erwinia tasmaniensis TaxID=338565 RepID=UPI003A4E2C7F
MTNIIWKPSQPAGTCLSRYKARRAARMGIKSEEARLERKIVCSLAGCSLRVLRAVKE